MELRSGYTGTVRNVGAIVTSALSIASGSTLDADSSVTVRGNLTNNGSVTGSSEVLMQWLANVTYILSGSGSFSELSNLRISSATSAAVLAIGSDLAFQVPMEFEASAAGRVLSVSNSGNYDLSFAGNVVFDTGTGGTINWTKGTGTITLAPPTSTTRQVSFGGKTIEDVIIDGAGTVELTAGFTTDSLTCTAGTLDVNGQALTVVGDMTVAAGCSVIE
jgi:hypothetical protein